MPDALDPTTHTHVATHAHLSRHQWTHDPQPVLDELDDTPTIREAAALWVGFHEHMPECAAMVQAVIAWVGAGHPALDTGRQRAAAPRHSAP